MQDRVEELQIKYSFQEDLLQELNKIIVQQQDDIAVIKSEIQRIKEELISLQENEGSTQSIDAEIPPHY
ncbi:MAG: SlyX family protein [Gammaproteobacteria bacterium]|nr:SlyX family protein [Gammaproteobacteria bacterium]